VELILYGSQGATMSLGDRNLGSKIFFSFVYSISLLSW